MTQKELMPSDEFTRKRNQREINTILKSVEGKRIRNASRRRLPSCPRCATNEHMYGHWQGSVLYVLCMKCGIEGVQKRKAGR
jgi:Zn ribbon nucleic-acid-binding protein